MKKSTLSVIIFSLISVFTFLGVANAYWIWTPQTKKFINPKYAAKDSPKEQYDWAMSFYDAKDFQRAATEFEKLAKQYEFSEYASKSQYYVGLCYENMGKYYIAFQNYQKAIDNFPHIANTDEILAREFAIGNIYFGKVSPRILGTDIMPPLDRAVEIFKKVVENAPYGKHAEEAQFRLGEALKKSERYEEAVTAFHKIVEDYPNSKLTTQAMYEESHCAYKASLRPAYDASATDNAIETFEKFTRRNKDPELAKRATATMKRLKDNVSEKSFRAAEFYEAQGKPKAAIIYYQDVIDSYPNSTFINQAKARIGVLKAKSAGKQENKKVSALPDSGKKKSKPIARESQPKKSWNPFSFKSKKPPSQIKISQQRQDTPKKKPWSLFNFGTKKGSTVKETPVKETPKKSQWKPLSFSGGKEEAKKSPEAPIQEVLAEDVKKEELIIPTAEVPNTESAIPFVEAPKAELETAAAEAPKEKIWKPLNFDSRKEPLVKDTPKKKSWSLFNFGTKKELIVKETPVKEPPKKSQWKPLSFDSEKELVVKGNQKNAEWKPLYFGTNDEPMGIKK